MNKAAALLIILLAMLPGSSAVHAAIDVALSPEQQRAVVEDAQELYAEGIALRGQHLDQARTKFVESAEQFELLVRAGVCNGKLHYNLANAQLQAGMVGPAILNYRRAQLLMPGNSDIASNLEFARSQVRSRITESGSRTVVSAIVEAVDIVPRDWRLYGALALWVIAWVLAIVRVMRPDSLPRSLAWWCASVGLLLAATVFGPQLLAQSRRDGVVMVNDVIVRMGNGEGYDAQFAEPIHEGVEFSVLDRRGEWLEIELPNGGTGWIRTDQAQLI